MNLQQIKSIVKTNNGATLTSNLDNAAINSGYMVSLQGHETKTSLTTLTSELLEDYKQIAESNGGYIGLWLDDEYLYIDISINIQEEAHALKLARDNKQLAIYNVSTSESIYI